MPRLVACTSVSVEQTRPFQTRHRRELGGVGDSRRLLPTQTRRVQLQGEDGVESAAQWR